MARVRVLDLDGSLAPQAGRLWPAGVDWVPAQDWGPQIRLACRFVHFDRFEKWLSPSLPPTGSDITLYGSGDFHHVTLALLRRIRGSFNLLVLDKHPDWMRGVPFLHCGTWLRHALQIEGLRRAFLCGGESDFDNAYRWLAPWSEIRAGRVVVMPARRRFSRGGWAQISCQPLSLDGIAPAETLRHALEPFHQELAVRPLYVSIDKDVLTAADAAVNWDSGLLRLTEAVAVVEAFLAAAGTRLVGADLLGDWSLVRLGNWLNRLCDHLGHPRPSHDFADAATRNARANLAFLRALQPGDAQNG
jgi:hypothetical protein